MTLASEWKMLDCERLDVYQRSIEFVALAAQALSELPTGQGGLRDQFRRAAMSIPLNIATKPGGTRSRAIERNLSPICARIGEISTD